MRFSCEFEHRDTGECKIILSALSAEEVRSVKALNKDADIVAEAMALRHAYAELPAGWHHTRPPGGRAVVMTDHSIKRKRGNRRVLAPVEPVDAKDGPMMGALPTDRHRAFVRALYQVKPGHGANVKAAKLAGFGSPTSTPQSMATIASRLAHDERVLAAIREEDEKRIRSSAPRAISALSRLVENPKHKDHARGIAMVLDRVHPAETVHKVEVEHKAASSMKATAEVFARIMELAARAGVPAMIDVTPEKAAS